MDKDNKNTELDNTEVKCCIGGYVIEKDQFGATGRIFKCVKCNTRCSYIRKIIKHRFNVMNSTFDEFRNNVFCRRDLNQHKARQLWKEISSIIDNSDKTLFQIEWSHFMMGELDADGLSLYFDKYVKKYYS